MPDTAADPWADCGPMFNPIQARADALAKRLDAIEAKIAIPRYAFYFKDGAVQRSVADLRAALIEDLDGYDALALFEDTATTLEERVEIGVDKVDDAASDLDYP